MTHRSITALHADVAAAGRLVAPQWPLSTIVAVNPLAGLEDRPIEAASAVAAQHFSARGRLALAEYRAALASGRIAPDQLGEALERRVPDLTQRQRELLLADLISGADEAAPRRSAETAAEQHDRRHGTHLRAAVDTAISDWCARWSVDQGDPAYWHGWQQVHPAAEAHGTDPAEALLVALDRLRVGPSERRRYLERHVTALPGWAAHLRWRDQQAGHPGDGVLLEHLAASVTLEAELLAAEAVRTRRVPTWFVTDGPAPVPSHPSDARRVAALADHLGPSVTADECREAVRLLPGTARAWVWQDAYERAVHDPLLAAIDAGPGAAAPGGAIEAQVICCIDVRSERLRRHLEAAGPYETYGYAGFFGLAARLAPLGAELDGPGAVDHCPAPVAASVALAESAGSGARDHAAAQRELARLRSVAAIDDGWRAAKYHPIAPLALAEASGWVAGPVAAARTALPGLAAWVADRLPAGRRPVRRPAYDRSDLPVAAQADVVAGVLRLGLLGPEGTAPLVVLCGHGARADNNPLESGLACGACGGNSGAPNARIVAAMANDPDVRAELAQRGLAISDRSWFVAAEHDTVADEVAILDDHLVPEAHRAALERLRRDLAVAGGGALTERVATLPGGPARHRSRRTRLRGRDWAEPVPELGLAGNMAFVVGPRELTRGMDLAGRAFLHSYEPDHDADGSILAGILTAPVVVAQWINAQYHFSTTDPEVFGSGSKVVHNVLGDVGVLSGPGGDLRRGLPLQSVRAGERLLHEPVRLLTVVQGELDHIDAALEAAPGLRQLVEHGWLLLVARRNPGDRWQQRSAAGWQIRQTAPALVGSR